MDFTPPQYFIDFQRFMTLIFPIFLLLPKQNTMSIFSFIIYLKPLHNSSNNPQNLLTTT
jgi:hypothetical protein